MGRILDNRSKHFLSSIGARKKSDAEEFHFSSTEVFIGDDDLTIHSALEVGRVRILGDELLVGVERLRAISEGLVEFSCAELGPHREWGRRVVFNEASEGCDRSDTRPVLIQSRGLLEIGALLWGRILVDLLPFGGWRSGLIGIGGLGWDLPTNRQ